MRYLLQSHIVGIFSLLLVALNAHARDAVTGKALAQACAVCHGPVGLSLLPNAPHLAGQPAIYLVEQLKSYRSGERENEAMSVIAKPLTNQELDDIAAWFASIEISVVQK